MIEIAGVDYPLDPPRPMLPPLSKYVAKVAFYSLFTAAELIAFNMARKQIAALQVSDYQAVISGTASGETQALVELEAFLVIIDAAGDINLLDSRLPPGLGLLIALGILAGQDRVTSILAGQAPAL